jgi:hypothetical protein
MPQALARGRDGHEADQAASLAAWAFIQFSSQWML